MIRFSKNVDMRSRSSMVAFLEGHRRRATLNANNGLYSFSNCVKIHRIGLPRDVEDVAFTMLDVEEPFRMIDSMIGDWTRNQEGRFTVGFNGRSNGYLVLYSSQYVEDKHRSVCYDCGQKNFLRVPPEYPDTSEGQLRKFVTEHLIFTDRTLLDQSEVIGSGMRIEDILSIIHEIREDINKNDRYNDGTCGCCHSTNMHPYSGKLLKIYNHSFPQCTEYEDAAMDSLRGIVTIVKSFDKLCDDIVNFFTGYCRTHIVEEQTVMIPQTIKVSVLA